LQNQRFLATLADTISQANRQHPAWPAKSRIPAVAANLMDSSFKPSQIGPYEVVSVIARDAAAALFKANDPRNGRTVAIKVLTATVDDPDLLLLKFYRETKNIPDLQHQNIATVYELGYENGMPYVVMEYLDGETLDAMITAQRSTSTAEKLRIVAQVCEGLAYAHKQDVIHRDIRPANIVVAEDGTAKIVDFGMARLGKGRASDTGVVVGSVNYLSPEQTNGNELDPRTDVYSTGVVLFQLLTGKLPFEAATAAATLKKIQQDPPLPMRQYMKDCTEELEAITLRALAKNRENRYATADGFGAEIARVQEQYEKQVVVEYLQYARDLLARKDFANARQQVLELLRLSPQNAEAEDLLHLIKQGQEQQQREQQLAQLQARAEDALRRNEFADALGIVDQGLQLDPAATALLRLKQTIVAAQEKMAKYREAYESAESALKAGDLDNAKQSIERATAIQPDDPQGRRLASQIRVRIEQQTRERQLAERKKRLENDIAIVETAMADARVLLASDQVTEALQRLEGIKGQVSQLPPKWGEEVESLRKEIVAQRERSIAPPAPAPIESPRIERDATSWGKITDTNPVLESALAPVRPPEAANRFPSAFDEPDDLHPLREQNVDLGREETKSVPRQPDRFRIEDSFERRVERPKVPRAPAQTRNRSIIWFGLAALVLVGVVLWLVLNRKSSRPVPPPPAPVAKYTYAEINAEPWATLKEVTPSSGDVQSALGSNTPLRIKLPPGQYSIVLEGPNHERKQAVITVPQEGGTNYFVVFKKPDLNRLVGHP